MTDEGMVSDSVTADVLPTTAEVHDESPETTEAGGRSTANTEASEKTPTDSASSDVVVQAEELSHSYGSVSVFENISLALERGTVTTLVGANGSGKTTLLKILAGLLTPTEGTVSYSDTGAARKLGYLPQQPAFRPGFSARETLAFYTSLVGGDPEALLNRVGLAHADDRKVEALSGGMTRLLGIAQATVGDPPIVVLDEPASGLDPGMRQQTFAVVAELAAAGTAVILSTHDTMLAERFADRVLLLGDGTVLTEGSPSGLIDSVEGNSLQAVFESTISRESGTVGSMGEST